jgi:hypothetical protein
VLVLHGGVGQADPYQDRPLVLWYILPLDGEPPDSWRDGGRRRPSRPRIGNPNLEVQVYLDVVGPGRVVATALGELEDP